MPPPLPRAAGRSFEERGGGGLLEFARVRVTRLATNVRAVLLSLAGAGSSDADESEQEQIDVAEVLHPLGFASRGAPTGSPTDTLEAVCVRDGDDVLVIAVVNKGLAKLATADLDEGEAMLHGTKASNVAAVVKINKHGDVIVTTVASRQVIVNGGTVPVAHEGSITTGHTHVVTGTAGPFTVSGTAATSTDTIATGAGTQDVLVRNT